MKYTPVIGLEVHVELNTRTKMFCRCSADYFGKEPNTHTCPVCLGLPGALPYINKQALESCLKIGLALDCKVSENSYFERKNYFYPDLPKGYQISQYRKPLCVTGSMQLTSGKQININRVHIEEDTGKLIHLDEGTAIDFNRSGVPLVEIVTEPDFSSSLEVKEFAQKLQQIFRYLQVSNADMERGDMRLEANVSVKPEDTDKLPLYRVELKNLNSFRFMAHAIEYEIKRQTEVLDSGERLTQETRGWSEEKGESYLQRSKEEAHDYRYFPEPDLPKFSFSASDVEEIKSTMPELPESKRNRFEEEYELSSAYAVILTETPEIADYFEQAASFGRDQGVTAKKIADMIVNKKVNTEGVDAKKLVEIIKSKVEIISMTDEELEQIVLQAIESNPKAVEDYKKGKGASLQFLLGQIMTKSEGRANPKKVLELLKEKMKNG